MVENVLMAFGDAEDVQAALELFMARFAESIRVPKGQGQDMDVRGLSYGLETQYGWRKEHALVVRVRSYKKNNVSGGELIVEWAFGCCGLIEYSCECWEQSDHQGREHHVQRSQVTRL